MIKHLREAKAAASQALTSIAKAITAPDPAAAEIARALKDTELTSVTVSLSPFKGSTSRNAHPHVLAFVGRHNGQGYTMLSVERGKGKKLGSPEVQEHTEVLISSTLPFDEIVKIVRPSSLDDEAVAELGDHKKPFIPDCAPLHLVELFKRLANEESGEAIVCARYLRRNAKSLGLRVKRSGDLLNITYAGSG